MSSTRDELEPVAFDEDALALLVQLASAREAGGRVLYGPFVCFETRRAWLDAKFERPRGIEGNRRNATRNDLTEDFDDLESRIAPWSDAEKHKSVLPPDRHRMLTLIQFWIALRVQARREARRPTMSMAARVLTLQRKMRGHARPETSVFVWRKWRQRAIERFSVRRDGESFTRLIVPLLQAKRGRVTSGE